MESCWNKLYPNKFHAYRYQLHEDYARFIFNAKPSNKVRILIRKKLNQKFFFTNSSDLEFRIRQPIFKEKNSRNFDGRKVVQITPFYTSNI